MSWSSNTLIIELSPVQEDDDDGFKTFILKSAIAAFCNGEKCKSDHAILKFL